MDVREWHDEIVFLHKVKPGAADRSYGIQVAKLAGLPPAVIARAREVLARLEKQHGKPRAALEDLPLFALLAEPGPEPAEQASDSLCEAVHAIDPDSLSPREALEAIYRLKALAAAKA